MKDSGKLLQTVHTGMVNAGLDVNAIYARIGFDSRKLSEQELRTPNELQAAFWQAVESVSGDADIGLRLCPHLPLYRGEVIDYLFLSSPTFLDGCKRSFKYLRLVSDALNVRLDERPDGSYAATFEMGSGNLAPSLRHSEICVVYSVIQFVHSTTGKFFRPPQYVKLRCSRRSPLDEYERAFGCPVSFDNPETMVGFDRALLDYRSPYGDPELVRLHEELAEKRLSRLERQDLIDSIRKLLAQRLELDGCSLEDVAKELKIPARRLRFELECAGTSFSQLLTEFRYALARRLLARTDERIENIVYLTGFSEPSTFYRAFKRWSGMTPVQYRETRRHKQSPESPRGQK